MEDNLIYQNLSARIAHLGQQLETVGAIHKQQHQYQQEVEAMGQAITRHFDWIILALKNRSDAILSLLENLASQQSKSVDGTYTTLQKLVHKCNETRRIGELYYEDDVRVAEDFWQKALCSTQPIVDMEELTAKLCISLPRDILDVITDYGKVSIKRPSSFSPDESSITHTIDYNKHENKYVTSPSFSNSIISSTPNSTQTPSSLPSLSFLSNSNIVNPAHRLTSYYNASSDSYSSFYNNSYPMARSFPPPPPLPPTTSTSSSSSSAPPLPSSSSETSLPSSGVKSEITFVPESGKSGKRGRPRKSDPQSKPAKAAKSASDSEPSESSEPKPPKRKPPKSKSAKTAKSGEDVPSETAESTASSKQDSESESLQPSESSKSSEKSAKAQKERAYDSRKSSSKKQWNADMVSTMELQGKPLFAEFKGICFNRKDNCVYICDLSNSQVLKCTRQGLISVVARKITDPHGIAVYEKDETLFVTNRSAHTITKVTSHGIATVFAGSGKEGRENGEAMQASFKNPDAITINQKTGDIFVADTSNHMIRMITQKGQVSTLAGSGEYDYAEGTGMEAKFTTISGLCYDEVEQCLLVCDKNNNCVRRVMMNGDVSYLCRVTLPQCVAVSKNRRILVAGDSNQIFKATKSETGDYELEPLAGKGEIFVERGRPTEVGFVDISSIILHEPSHSGFVAERMRIRVITFG